MKFPQKAIGLFQNSLAVFKKITGFLGERKSIIVCSILFKIFLDIAYCIISAYWDYYGFSFAPSFWHMFFSWVIFTLAIIATDDIFRRQDSNARPIFLILVYINFLPMLTLFGYGAITARTMVYATVYYGLMYFFAFRFDWFFGHKNALKNWDKPIQSKILSWILAAGCCLAIVFISGKYADFRFSLNLDKVYEWRAENKASMSVLARYVFGAAIACNVAMLSYCLAKKKYLFSAVLAAIQIMAFSVDGLKSTLFVMVFALIALVYHRGYIERLIPAAVMGISGLGLVEYMLGKSMFIINYLNRRVMLLTGVITNHYVDFFTKNTPDYFMQGPLRLLGFESVYEREISYMIGAEYYIDGINFNSGLLSEAVANLGFVGVLIMPVFVAVFLKVYGKISHGLPRSVVFASSLYIAWFLLSSTLTTTLATHGVFALLILIACLPKDTYDSQLTEASK